MVFDIENLETLPETARIFLRQMGNRKHFAIFGPMGVGKTTFIKEVCKQLKVNEVVTSPTFALVNEYSTQSGQKIYHFDFYRIKREEELYDIGYEDYVYGDDYCFIEWPEKAPDLIPSHFTQIRLEEVSTGKRRMYVEIDESN
jgi:tRNA threonylcarbamoyladenosine biosynthesis protein TsaE